MSDQGEAGAADGEKEGDDVQVGRQMGLAQTLWVKPQQPKNKSCAHIIPSTNLY